MASESNSFRGRQDVQTGAAIVSQIEASGTQDDRLGKNINASETATVTRGASKRVTAVLGVAAAGMLITAVATEWARQHWLLDLMACLRVQQVIAILVLLSVAGYRRGWIPITCLLLALTIHLRWFGPAWPQETSNNSTHSHAPTITVSIANVLIDNPRHGEAIATLLRWDPDVFAVFELNHALSDQLRDRTKHRYPDPLTRPNDAGSFGIALFSKHPMSDIEVFELDEGIPSVAATIQFANRPIRMFLTHPLPPMGPERSRRRDQHLHRLGNRIIEFRKRSAEIPVMVVGDLNLTPWSPIFHDLTTRTRLRRAIDHFNLTPTHYSGPSLFPFGLIIDHALIDDALQCRGYHVGDDFGSDHRGVTVWLSGLD